MTDAEGNGWFNGYYDNNGNQVEGVHGGNVRMMLTSQVFSIMSGTADAEMTAKNLPECGQVSLSGRTLAATG